MSKPLLDPGWLSQLERMQILSRRLASGTQAGKRRSRQTGSSLEFADYRVYAPGDDLRQLDWNAYARSGKLFVKKFLDEQELHVTLYIDCSKSMGYGEPTKLERAVQLAAALGYISLCHLDYVSVYAFDREIVASLRNLQGKNKAAQLFQFLSSLSVGGAGDLEQAMRSPGAIHGKPGVSLVLSDFLFESGYEEGIAYLQATRQDVALVQLLSREERDPAYQGELRLIDSETTQGKEISVTHGLMDQYRKAVRDYQEELAQFAYKRGIAVLDVETERPLEEVVFRVFRQAGMIR
ncbi:DUF58 domain-containing protein [Brevibacillus ruminantium]|uniref:DUF58 domain-containing protein n=1 Tax=Brevibacillus ruminantium TaxID=2950604 RepID=A0ABY4WCM3_9BACL|nr:DUF58 domain-containing protein [Brevibacillus ruminantium]USG64940.1 DUF58 domain-containing protein [Brevibacillus ruminantium]